MNAYWSAQEAAAYLQMTVPTLYRLVEAGEIRGSQRRKGGRWRFDRDDLDAWLDEHENRPRCRRRKRSA